MPRIPRELHASILIPTRARPHHLAACLAGLARQHGLDGAGAEVIVAIDSPDPGDESAEAAERAWRDAQASSSLSLRIETLAPPTDARATHGCVGVRNLLAPGCRGSVFVSINDDVRPEPGFLAAHLARHAARAARRQPPAIIVGDSRFAPLAELCAPNDPPTLADRLVTETGLVFFYDAMTSGPSDADRDWGYRHAFGLNVSLPRHALLGAGGYTHALAPYGYEDIELAHRLREAFGSPVLYDPDARAPHHHRYRPDDLLRREQALGRAARAFAEACPSFARDLFRTDLADPATLAHYREAVERDRADAERQTHAWHALERTPAGCVTGEPGDQQRVLQALADGLRLVRRWRWRLGVLEQAEAMTGDDAQKPRLQERARPARALRA
ncbi:MAG: hypothetical protein EA378_07180 [Phycisphaerales bacterium]|nr:MAG: hypothetical protein EA378_07180 [Phycisphaerales bacterium]